jgi:hypothetical protein
MKMIVMATLEGLFTKQNIVFQLVSAFVKSLSSSEYLRNSNDAQLSNEYEQLKLHEDYQTAAACRET